MDGINADGMGLRALPLNGVTVLDLGQIYNGPYAAFLFAANGARVIKIEPPGGENMRRRASVSDGAMLPFAMLNSNKEFVTINLKSDEGRALFLDMVRKADVLLENFAPGVMDRLGIGPERLLQENPRLVYAAGSGYGWTGPYRDYLAMDLTVQAMSGVMASTGFPDRPPVKAGAALCDFFGAAHLYGAAVTALADAMRTGKGRFVEVSMLEAVYPTLSSPLGLYHSLGNRNPPRTGNRHGGLAEAPYNVYPTSDGHVALFCVSEAHWTGLTEAMEKPELRADARFVDLASRVAHVDDLDAIIGGWTLMLTKDDLLAACAKYRVPCAPVRDLDEVVNDPHMHARGALQRVNHPDLGDVILPAGTMRFAGAPPAKLRPSGAVGADNQGVFRDWLGLGDADIEQLVRAGAI
ncbi:CaiB/BaiF CoA-transferase family protein [Sphingobium sp.]|uniref:CaiB/BaiF CoA transferase family protein n=1 Tax=Sphingobium sp. TaxID=1912891 RepID=UPI00263A2603|nr:CaiB/BaiF CoA-transferase family protein [Sphingobium sp.]